MEFMYERCCGIDVHKRMIIACFICGKKRTIREFGTTSKELRILANWLHEEGCEMSAMESTGPYWKPLFNVFELMKLPIIVVNARDMRNVPGRKTDIKDAEWIADLLQHGLLKASYIPDRKQRELRDLCRYRANVVRERANEINRLQKMLEGGNIKLASVVTDINGKSARNLLLKIISSNEALTEKDIKELTHGALRKRTDDLLEALDGFLSARQKILLTFIIDHIDDMTKRIEKLNGLIKENLEEYEDAIERLQEIPGIGRRSAETIIVEIGLDMNRFPSAKHLASWAGLAPGNNESAGKRKSGKTTKGNKTLKKTLVQCAKSGAKRKTSFLAAQYSRIAVRRGKNRATVAVAHTMLISIYNMLKSDVHFIDLGVDYYNKFNPARKIQHHLKKLRELGYPVDIATSPA